ncbi:MAG: hypothetical protein NXI08_09765 [bacterium]|nr:hypothetical protein [bacterium]
MSFTSPHTFHIPVMGTGYTIDTPIRVAHYGISSVISIIDHRLTEQMREFYSKKFNFEFTPIKEKEADCRARRITAYLNLVKQIVDQNTEALRNSPFEEGSEITKYFEMLPETSPLRVQYLKMLDLYGEERHQAEERLRKKVRAGAIDVNIMTKIDGGGIKRVKDEDSVEFNDAHAALRGFANSELASSVVFSAGLNPRLYGYLSQFEDFLPDANGFIKKKVILKISDYRSALIQGKFLAKKGIWVSEYRLESGLNCGGHAFATDGYLMGPILKEFNQNKHELKEALLPLISDALADSKHLVDAEKLNVQLTVQGGVGTSKEHEFLLNTEQAHSVGWGSPFLLVPEAVSIDEKSLQLLTNAKEEDYYLSEVSPLGVSFNTIKGNSAEVEREARIESGKPGAPCVKKHLAFNNEVSKELLCTASVKYQKAKIDELLTKNLAPVEMKKEFKKIVEKVCLCVGLANGALLDIGEKVNKGTQGVAICPGPNTAYFNNVVSLKDMVDHIYGRVDLLALRERPNMFIKELELYVKYIKNLKEELTEHTGKQFNYVKKFLRNLDDGITFYDAFFEETKSQLGEISEQAKKELQRLKTELTSLELTLT